MSEDWLNPNAVIDAVVAVSGVSKEALLGRGARSNVSLARKAAVHLLYTRSKMSLNSIAHMMAGRDHTSILYLRRQALTLPPEFIRLHTDKAEQLHREEIKRLV